MIHNFPSRVQGSRCGGLPVSLEAILPAGEPKGVQHSGAVQRAHKLLACPTPLRSANRGSKPCTKTRKPKKPSAGCEPCSNPADLVSKTDTFILPLRNTTGCPRMRRQGVGRQDTGNGLELQVPRRHPPNIIDPKHLVLRPRKMRSGLRCTP